MSQQNQTSEATRSQSERKRRHDDAHQPLGGRGHRARMSTSIEQATVVYGHAPHPGRQHQFASMPTDYCLICGEPREVPK